jgi:hypothetical protein
MLLTHFAARCVARLVWLPRLLSPGAIECQASAPHFASDPRLSGFANMTGFVDLATSGGFLCGLRADGSLYCV